MADYNLSANMNLPIPVVGVDPGPDWALNVDSCLALLDVHDHSNGKGVKITPAGINITSDLSFVNNNAYLLRSTRFSPQSAALAGASDLGCLYEVGVDLYYNDGNGNNVRITQSGGVAGSPGSISNLTSPASATYVSANQTFVWQSAANTPANMDFASAIFRNLSANSFGVTLGSPLALGSDYALTLPAIPPGQQIMTLDNAGAMSAPYTVDGTSIKIISNVIGVDGSQVTNIDGANIQAGSINAATQLTAQSVTQDRLALRPFAASTAGAIAVGSTGNITNGTGLRAVVSSVTLATTGRPVMIMAVSPGGGPSYFQITGTGSALFEIINTGTGSVPSSVLTTTTSGSTAVNFPPSNMGSIIESVPAGTYTWSLNNTNGGVSNSIVNVRLLAYEL